jgi:uncharacterized DUF497 family protein
VDEEKNRSNRRKHGVWFEEAPRAFRDPIARLFDDPEHSDDEDRFVLMGMSSTGRPLVVVHCYEKSDSVIRLISARKATNKEFMFYEEGI